MKKSKYFKGILGSSIVVVVLCVVLSMTVFADSISSLIKSITLQDNETKVEFEVVLNAEEDFAGAEFGFLPSTEELVFESLSYEDEAIAAAKHVQTVKNGVLFFGFFDGDNTFTAGEHTVAKLQYSFIGDEDAAVELASSKIVVLTEDEDGNPVTEVKQNSEDFTVEIKRVKSEAVTAVVEKIDALPAAEEVTAENQAQIVEARDAFEELTPSQQKLVDTAKLDAAEDALIAAVEAVLAEVPAAADVTLDSEAAIQAAKDALAALDEKYQELVDPALIAKMEDANTALLEAKIAEAQAGAETDNAKIAELQKQLFAAQKAAAKAQTVDKLKVKAQKGKKVKVTWKANKAVAGYQIQYSTSKKFTKKTTKTVTIKKAATKKKVIKKLKANKKYFVRIRTFSKVTDLTTGKAVTVFGKWSASKNFKAKK